jgi:hypothetical protein
MSKFETKPSRGMRVWAGIVAIVGLCSLIFSDRASSRVIAAAMLLGAWEMAFVSSLPFNLTLGEIYQKSRQGWRMSRTSRIINYACVSLIILGIYLQHHGR